MISDLIINIAMLMSFTFIWHQLLRKKTLSFSSPISIKLIDGVCAGILGIILMHYSIQVNEITILDLRHIPVILVAYYGGFIPAIISSIVITIGRFFIAVNFSSYVALFMMAFIALGAGFISHYVKTSPWKKWTLLLFYSQSIFSIALYIVVDNFSHVLDFAIYHILSTFIGGFLTYYFVNYIRKNNERYFRYKEYSQRDSLTGLYNVRSFDYFYEKMLEKTINDKQSCAVCLIDIDHFKHINDSHGHTAGDEVLKQLATLLSELTRAGDKVSRNGGEEFSILLPDCTVEQAKEIAVRIRQSVAAHEFCIPDESSIQISVSIGVSAFHGETDQQFCLIQQADSALYKAKQSGRNIVCTATECLTH